MKKLVRYLSVLALLPFCNSALGQATPQKHTQQVDRNSILYRGPVPQTLPFRYNGSIYAFQDAFTLGDLWYNGKFYQDISMNLDAFRDELYVRIPNAVITIVLEKNLIEKFTLEGKEFINISKESFPSILSTGFYQVIYNGNNKLLKRIKQEFSERPNDLDSRGVYRYFEPVFTHVLIRENKVYSVKSIHSFSKIYKEQKNEIRKFIQENKLKFLQGEQIDSGFKQIIQFIDGRI